jgi:ABC-type transport system substrate-binding protein
MLVLLAATGCDAAGPPTRGVAVIARAFEFQAVLERPSSAGYASIVATYLHARLLNEDLGQFLPGVAQSLSTSADGRVVLLGLREGLRFASGRPVTSADVVASIRARVPDSTLRAGAVDDRNVRLDLEQPRINPVTALARVHVARADQAGGLVGPPLPLEDLDGSGSWQVGLVREPYVVLVPNPHSPERPGLDALVVWAVGSQRDLLAAVVAGEADDVQFDVTGRDQDLINDFSPLELSTFGQSQDGVIRYNCRSPRLADPRVRRALSFAVDRESIIRRFVSRRARPLAGLGDRPPIYDPVLASRLLDEAGWRRGPDGVRSREGVRLELVAIHPDFFADLIDVVQAVAADLHAIGVEVTIEAGPGREIQARRAAGDFDLTFTWYVLQSSAEHSTVTEYFRLAGQAVGLSAGAWDFGRCALPLQPSVVAVDLAAGTERFETAMAGLVAATELDPPALFVWHQPKWAAVHPRFESDPQRTETLSSWSSVRVRPGLALPRDRLEVWLAPH